VPFTDGASVEEIEGLFKRLGRIGNGLYELMQKCPSMGKLFGAWRTAASKRVAHQLNHTCTQSQSSLLAAHRFQEASSWHEQSSIY
jgi:hypothetical protein